MEQSADPWSIDPSQLLKPGDMLNNNYNNKKKALYTPESDSNIFLNNNDNINNPSEIDDPLGMNYYDIDKFLTQELRDLDIPMIPITQDTSVNFEDQFNWDASNNNNNNINNSNNLNYSTMNYDTSMTQSQTMPSHKRGMSGTAIFGFQNHNKTLSIASLQRSGMENGPNNNNNNNNIFNNNNNNNKSNNNNENGIHGDANEIIEQDDEVSQLILRQQEELRLALEKQKMVNQKLQEQLRANQLQQERLQRALEEQNDSQTTNNTNAAPSPQRSIRTPARPASGEALIITSNSADGKYQFPPPSMISPALTNTSLNGSPSKRSGAKARNPMFSMSTSSVPSSTSPSKYSNNIQSTEDSIPNLFKSMNEEEPKQHNGIDALNSPFFTTSPSNRHQRHKKKESVVSTVSTIPLSACDSDTESSSPQRLVGLGLTMENNNNNSNNSNEDKITSRRSPMRIDVMPTIPASTENTPIKDPAGGDNHLNAPNSIPRKHLFQHTPVKQRPEYVIINNNNTPILNPPPSFPILSPGNINNNNNIYHRTTLSPRFNGERNYILESPPMPPPVEPHLGPMKITRKPTTLPRGSIDQYVKELPDKQFECLYPNCGKTFKRRYNIRSHIQTHLEDRPYTCDHPGCKKAFVRNHDLVRHKKSHLNKILSCPCGKKFADEELLIQHRDRMVCQNGTRPEKMMVGKGNNISTSPRRNVVGGSTITTPLGSPNKKSTRDGSESPIKRSMDADHTGYVRNKLEEQLFYQQNEQYLEPDGLNFPVLTPSPPSGLSDLGE